MSPSTTSPGVSSVGSFDRYRREIEAAARPAAGARFLMTWVTLTFVPALAVTGAVTDCTARSGCTI